MRILLIGGSNLIGYYLIPDLMAKGHQLTVITRGHRDLPHPVTEHLIGDRTALFNQGQVQGVFDAVIDTVAYGPEDCRATLAALEGRLSHYIVISTAFVYPELETAWHTPSAPVYEEDASFSRAPSALKGSTPHNDYVYGKRQMEYWLHQKTRRMGVKTTIIRPLLQVVGPNTEDGRFAWFWLRIQDGGPIWLPDEARRKAGPCQLSFSGDVARVIAASLTQPPEHLAVFNAGQPELWTYEEYLGLMAHAAGRSVVVRYAPRDVLNQWAGGTYRIPLPYPIAFDVAASKRLRGMTHTPMREWIGDTGRWMTAHYAGVIPQWYQARESESRWESLTPSVTK